MQKQNCKEFIYFSDDLPRMFVVEKFVDGRFEAVTSQLHWIFPLDTKQHSTYHIRVTAVSPKYVFEPQLSENITLYGKFNKIKPYYGYYG